MEGKKISFGFMKTKKAEKPFTPIITEEKRDYIECVEEKSIKVVGGETVTTEDLPLVIPMKPNTLITAEKLKQIAEKVESAVQEPEINEETIIKEEKIEIDENETLEQMAVRELLQEAKKNVKVEVPDNLAIPTPAKPVMTGEKESTLDDYESVPIQQFGMAMLRGMGWTPSKEGTKYKQPELRPKGLGLGADKVVKGNQKKQTNDKKQEELAIVKNSFVKITTGKHSGYYGKDVLRKIIAKSIHILENKSTTTPTNIKKAQEWRNVAKKFNAITMKNRSDNEVKLAWKRMKLAAKATWSAHRQFQMQTGGGEKPKSPTQEDMAVMEIAPHEFTVEYNEFDSDAIQTAMVEVHPPEDTTIVAGPSSTIQTAMVVSLDEDNGRVMVDIAVKKETVSLSEFMMHAVTKSEYDKESKVINADSYEEYKKTEKVTQKPPKQEERSSTSQRGSERNEKTDRERSNDDHRRQREDREEKSSNGRNRERTRERRDSSSSEDRSRRKEKKDRKRYSSNDSLSSSDDNRRRTKHKSKSRRHRSSSEDSHKRSSEVKRDIDKKRKGKKKKRDRDRSPNYKKHRK